MTKTKNCTMNYLPIIMLTLVCVGTVSSNVQHESQQRQARSVSQSGSQANMIDQHGPIGKISKIEAERKQVQEFITPKNIMKVIMKLIFGSPDEINASSRNVISILGKVLDLVKANFGHKSRSAGGRASVRDWAEDAANGAVTMLQGYVKSVLSTDDQCVQKHLCQASREAAQNREMGYLVASAGGYFSSYLLEANKQSGLGFKALYDAAAKGRNANSIEECAKMFVCEKDV